MTVSGTLKNPVPSDSAWQPDDQSSALALAHGRVVELEGQVAASGEQTVERAPVADTSALRACPFCGCTVERSGAADCMSLIDYGPENGGAHVECDRCGTCGPWALEESEARRLWNLRATESKAGGAV